MSTVDSDLDVPGGATRPAPGDTEVTPARLARVGDLDVLFLLGGEPVGETLLMWWNFVGRTPAGGGDLGGTAPGRHRRGGARLGHRAAVRAGGRVPERAAARLAPQPGLSGQEGRIGHGRGRARGVAGPARGAAAGLARPGGC